MSVLLIGFNSCKNEAIDKILPQQDNVTIEYNDEYQGRAIGIHYLDLVENGGGSHRKTDDPNTVGPTVGPNSDCQLEDCDTVWPALRVLLQQLANENCETVYGEIPCCLDGNITYALMYADPQNPPCPNAPAKW